MNHILLPQTFDKTRLCRKQLPSVRACVLLAVCHSRMPYAPQEQPLSFVRREKRTDGCIQVIRNSYLFGVLDELGQSQCYCLDFSTGFLWYKGQMDCLHQ